MSSPPRRRAAPLPSSPSDALLSPVSRVLKRKRGAAKPQAAARALPVVLGSASSGRRSVLARRGLVFDVCAAAIDERAVAGRLGASPGELALAVARAKADAIKAGLRAPCLLITADQVVLGPDGVPREKPDSPAQARAFVASYAGASSRTVSAVVVTNTATGAQAQGVAVETVRFAPSLGQPQVLDAALQPAPPVDARGIRAGLRGTTLPAAAAAAAPSSSSGSAGSSTAATTAEPAAAAPNRRRSARFTAMTPHAPPASSTEAVSVLTTAGAVIIEHPAIAAHVSSIERGDTVAAPQPSRGATVASGGGGEPHLAAEHRQPTGPDDDDDDVVDSIYGLPWRLLQRLVAQAAPGHPWAAC